MSRRHDITVRRSYLELRNRRIGEEEKKERAKKQKPDLRSDNEIFASNLTTFRAQALSQTRVNVLIKTDYRARGFAVLRAVFDILRSIRFDEKAKKKYRLLVY